MGSRSDSYRLHEPAKCDKAKTGEACYLLQARTARRRTESEIVDNPCIAGAAPKRRDLSLQEAHAEDQRRGPDDFATVVPPFAPSAYADRGAVGLLVPGAGSTVSRERALASLVRGRVVFVAPSTSTARHRSSLRTVRPPPPSTSRCHRQGHITTSRAIPSRSSGRGTAASDSGSTRIDGLVSLADIAPTANAIAAGETPAYLAPDSDAAASLAPSRRAADPGPRRAHRRNPRARRAARRLRRPRDSRPPATGGPCHRARRLLVARHRTDPARTRRRPAVDRDHDPSPSSRA